jgi:pimeloyl-ACP methyl ester carboxylesterase
MLSTFLDEFQVYQSERRLLFMRKIFLFACILLLILFLSFYFQYRGEIAAARQRVLDGSSVLSTEYGEIEYAVEGKGPAVLVIHGAGGGYDQGMLIGKKALGDGFTFISVSRFGYLRSPFIANSTVENQTALYVELLNHLGVDKVIVVGASAGGPSALQFAHDYPERSSALVLLSAVSMFMGDEIPIPTRVINTIQRSDFLFWAVLKIFRTQFSEMVGIPQNLYDDLTPEDKQYADDMLDFMNPISPRRPGNIHEAEIRPLSGEAMSRITVPTIVLHAKDDFLVTFDHAEFVHQNIKHSELVSFESGGHALVAELEIISARINDFLKKDQ